MNIFLGRKCCYPGGACLPPFIHEAEIKVALLADDRIEIAPMRVAYNLEPGTLAEVRNWLVAHLLRIDHVTGTSSPSESAKAPRGA